MGITAIDTIAGVAFSLLAAYLRSLGEQFAKKASEEIGEKAGEAA